MALASGAGPDNTGDIAAFRSRNPVGGVVDDLPGDVRSVLTQLFEEGATAIEADDCETARRTVETARTVSLNKLPAGDLRAQLLHGCDRAAAALDPADGTEPVVATEYLRAMASRVERTDQ